MKYLSPILLALLMSCGGGSEKHSVFNDKLDRYFSSKISSKEPGAAVLVMKGDEIVFSKGYGLANLKTNEEISPETLFNLGSISKTFVSNAILMLAEDGKLSLEDSIIKYFPDFKNKEIARKVKIKHLLTHTSGLPDNRQVSKDSVFYLTAKDAENWYPITQTDTLEFEPGTHYNYSNPAFNALALIVEQVGGMKWQQFINREIFRIAGMRRSTITDGPHPEHGVSHGYVLVNGKWQEKDYGEEPTFPAAGNGGVWSSVVELAKYEQAIQKAYFLPEDIIERSRRVTEFENWKGAEQPFIGWSWFIGKTPDGLKTVGHTGDQGGFHCNYVTVPEKEIFFVILCNAPHDVEDFTEEIMRTLKDHNWLEAASTKPPSS